MPRTCAAPGALMWSPLKMVKGGTLEEKEKGGTREQRELTKGFKI